MKINEYEDEWTDERNNASKAGKKRRNRYTKKTIEYMEKELAEYRERNRKHEEELELKYKAHKQIELNGQELFKSVNWYENEKIINRHLYDLGIRDYISDNSSDVYGLFRSVAYWMIEQQAENKEDAKKIIRKISEGEE